MQTYCHINHQPASTPKGPMPEIHIITHQTVYMGADRKSASADMSAIDSNLETNSAAHSGWMTRLVVHLFRCRHEWSITAINGFGSPSEETCIKCGEYRHRIHDHRIIGREEWNTGKHPKSK